MEWPIKGTGFKYTPRGGPPYGQTGREGLCQKSLHVGKGVKSQQTDDDRRPLPTTTHCTQSTKNYTR